MKAYKQLLSTSMKVIFLDTWSKEEPKIGWIVANNARKIEMHPYIVSIDQNKKDIKDTDNRSIEIDDTIYYFIHKNLIRPFTENDYKKIIRNNNKLRSKKMTINIYSYNHYCLSKQVVSILYYELYRDIKNLINRLRVIVSFCYNVFLIGTLWLFFGNIIKLYTNQYEKYKIRKEINQKIKQMSPDSFYFNGDGPITDDDEVITRLHDKLDQVSKEVETSSLNLITLFIALVSILISILK